MNTIFTRASVRRFLPRQVEADQLIRLVRAGMAAPTAGDQRPWEFYVDTDPESIARLSQATPYARAAKGAPAVIIPCYRTNVWAPSCCVLDLSAATENILLEAASLGLGAVWMGVAPQEGFMKAVGEILQLPEDVHPFALIPCGYPAEPPKPRDKFDPERIHWIQAGSV